MRLTLQSDPPAKDAGSGQIVRVAAEGEITGDAYTPEREPMQDLLGPGIFSQRVLLSLENATSLISTGIGWLLICHKHFVQAKGRLILHSVPPAVAEVLELISLHLVLNIAVDEAEAMRMAQREKP